MLQEFLDGNLWLLIDKEQREDILNFCDIIQNYIQTWAYQAVGDSLYEYLCHTRSGPYHFVKNTNHLTGSSYHYNHTIVSLRDFLNNLDEPDIQEDEMMEMLK